MGNYQLQIIIINVLIIVMGLKIVSIYNRGKQTLRSLLDKRQLLFPLLFLALVTGVMWLYLGKDNDDLKNFGLNAFTEILSVIFTIFVIESIVERSERKRLLPLRVVAYSDICLLVNKITGFWADIFRQSISYPTSTIACESLFTVEKFQQIMQCVDIEATFPNVLPKVSWVIWFSQTGEEFDSLADKILERHFVDPVALSLVYELQDNHLQFFRRVAQIRQVRTDSNKLGSYFYIDQNALDTILALHSWCIEEMARLESENLPELRRVAANV